MVLAPLHDRQILKSFQSVVYFSQKGRGIAAVFASECRVEIK